MYYTESVAEQGGVGHLALAVQSKLTTMPGALILYYRSGTCLFFYTGYKEYL